MHPDRVPAPGGARTLAPAGGPARVAITVTAAATAAALCAGCVSSPPPVARAPAPQPPPPVAQATDSGPPVELAPVAGAPPPLVDAPASAAARDSRRPYSAHYGARLAQAVRANIVFPVATAVPRVKRPCEVDVSTAPDGRIVGFSIVASSGLREWDDAVRRALLRTRALPPDVDGRVPASLVLRFTPR